jgi:type 1 glutamine amidotransferase
MAKNTTLLRRLYTNLVRRKIMEVAFTKRDGTHRVMYCSLGEKGRVDTKTVTVFDLEKNQYRSIRKSTIQSVSIANI